MSPAGSKTIKVSVREDMRQRTGGESGKAAKISFYKQSWPFIHASLNW